MKFNALDAAAIDPYIAELGRDGWTFVAEVESTGELVELRCDALPTVAAIIAGDGSDVRRGRIIDEVEEAVESAALAYGLDGADLQADALIEGAWDVADSIFGEAERLAK